MKEYVIAWAICTLILLALGGLVIYSHEKEEKPLFKDKRGK